MAAIIFPVPMAASLSSSSSTTFLAVSSSFGNGGSSSRSNGGDGSSNRKSCSRKWEAVANEGSRAGWSSNSRGRSKGNVGVSQGRLISEVAPWSGRIESREGRNAWCPGTAKSCCARNAGGDDGQGRKKANKRQNRVVGKGGWFGLPGNANCRGNAQFPGANASAAGAEVAAGGDDIGSGGAGIGDRGGSGGGGGGDDSFGGQEGSDSEQNRTGSLALLATVGKTLESLPDYLASAVKEGKIPPKVLERFLDLEKTTVRQWLLRFSGFRERLLADDLFLTKVGIECGVGLFTKTGAEYERRRENFMKELDFVIADVLMALVADFMLVWLPAPTVALRPTSLAVGGGAIGRFFAGCPDNAFQVALRGTAYSIPQRVGAILRNGAKLLVVGTSASLLGTGATNGLIKLRQKYGGSGKDEGVVVQTEEVPILETSLAYGVYMAVSSNLRYQLLAGVVEQRMLEPLLEKRKLALSVSSFVVRTGNTFLGSLLWVDYARWVGVQTSE